MTTKAILALATLALALTPVTTLQANDDVNDFIKRLKGNAKSETKSRFDNDSQRDASDRRVTESNRGEYDNYLGTQPQRGVSDTRARAGASSSSSPSSKTRKLSYATSAAVPSSLRRAASDERVDLYSSGRGGMELTYAVDSASKISRDDILFRKGSTEFADRYSYELVRDLAFAMQDRELRGMQFVIEGHASAEGSYDSNQRLSQRRADRIVSEMVRLGVNPHALIAVGYGESEARYDAGSPERLRANDRKVVVYRMD